MSNNNGGGTLLGFIIGAAVGAVAGLLLAPKPGKELRGDLKEFSEKLAEDARAEYVKMGDKAKDLSGRAKQFAEETKGKIRKGGESRETPETAE